MTEEKRPTFNVRAYEDTIEELRKEVQRRKDLGIETTYAQLIEESWKVWLIEQLKHPDGLFTITNYLHANLPWHDQLEVILNSKVDAISEAIQKNLVGFEKAVNAIRARWQGEGDPNEEERELVDTVLGILRSDDNRSVRRELLLALLKESRKFSRGSRPK